MKNTKKKTTLHFAMIPSKDKKGWYTAICFELGIVREGSDFLKLGQRIQQVANEYYKTILENNLSDDLLNQPVINEYKAILEKIKAEELKKEWEKYFNERIMAWKLKMPNGKTVV